jgi:type IV pilus assembly protein PilY1
MINIKSTCQLITSHVIKYGITALVCFAPHISNAVNFTPLPPYLSETKGAPMVMLNLSRDHQLFYKAYNEYSDLDGDGVPETQYSHSYRYYGYFDNRRCYTYNSTDNRFVPSRKENGASSTSPT